jgi:ankyrin repeat protein
MGVLNTLLELGADPGVLTRCSGMSTLMLASGAGWTQAVEVLIRHGVDVNARDKRHWTALMHACANSSSAHYATTVNCLIAAGADVNLADEFNLDAITLAARGSVEVLEVLLGAGAAKVKTNSMALHLMLSSKLYPSLEGFNALCKHCNLELVDSDQVKDGGNFYNVL